MVSRSLTRNALGAALLVAALTLIASPAGADGDLTKVNHIIIMTQENHSFDNYFGALPYAKGTPYHASKAPKGSTVPVCKPKDHKCVDGLTCTKATKTKPVACSNSNPDPDGNPVIAFHQTNYCPGPDLEHSWAGTHKEANYSNPQNTLTAPMDGFVRVNAEEQAPNQASPPFDTMGYYNEVDLPFYYFLAENFAINDRFFSATLGQSFPNHSYALAATSFGHLTTSESLLSGNPHYEPITGSIFDLLDANHITWADYYSDAAWSLLFQPATEHQKPIAQFASDAAAGTLPAVALVSGSLFPDYDIGGTNFETDEHPPYDIRGGQYYVWQNVMALRNSPSWNDSIVFILHDDPGGFYDHVPPPLAPQAGQSTPDGIAPGQCEDLSNPPASLLPGGGLKCEASAAEAPLICSAFAPTGPYPSDCPTFDQLGFRVPFIAVSPFAKKKYVSHTVSDHSSLLALIENRFLQGARMNDRDRNANDLEDMFDFKKKTPPSLKTKFTVVAPPPVQPDSAHNCPFVKTADLMARSDDDD